MAEPRATLAGAMEAARQGMAQAQQFARQAAGQRALLGAGDGFSAASAEGEAAAAAHSDLAGDMVQLSRSLGGVRANAASIRIVSGVSEEVINLGRRIDIQG